MKKPHLIPPSEQKITASWMAIIVGMLMDYLGNDTGATAEAWTAVVGGASPDVISTLLDRMTGDFELTEPTLEKALTNNSNSDMMLRCLLFHKRTMIKVEKEQLMSILHTYESRFKHYSENTLKLLLYRQGEVNISENIIQEVVGDSYGPEMLYILLDRGYSLPVTEKAVCAAAGHAGGTLTLLLLIFRGYN